MPKLPATAGKVVLFVGTRKGAFVYRADSARSKWKVQGPQLFGSIVHHVVQDPRSGTILCAARTGHLGPTVFRSTDGFKTLKEASRPPAFEKAKEGQKGRVLDHLFWLTPGHPSEPKVWYGGSSPQGLFRSEDDGVTWGPVAGFNSHPKLWDWIGGDKDGTPDGPKLHSILVDPRDASHLYLSMSSGGTFESRDRGASWRPLNAGVAMDFFPKGQPLPEYGHDPHCVALHPLMPDRLYQQNHCGIYRMERAKGQWERIGKKMPKEVGDIGFPIVLHPRDPDVAWVVPMDGTSVWPRTAVDGKPAVFRTSDAGKSWKRQDKGLPAAQAWFTVKRQAFSADHRDPVGLYFGTTSGEVWHSLDEGAKWRPLVRHLPHVYSVTTGIA